MLTHKKIKSDLHKQKRKRWLAVTLLALLLLLALNPTARRPAPPLSVLDFTPPPPATSSPTSTPSPSPISEVEVWQPCPAEEVAPCLIPPPAEAQALRTAFAALLQRVRLPAAPTSMLLAYDPQPSIAVARRYVATDFSWPLLETDFVFVYTTRGRGQQPLQCKSTTRCRIVQELYGIHSVLLCDATLCREFGHIPCLVPLRDDQLDARDNRILADFRRDPDGVWRLTGWETVPLPAK